MSSHAKLRVAVLISGSGTNLQAIIDQTEQALLDIDIVGVISDRPDAHGLERARRANIETLAIEFRSFAKRSEYDTQLDTALASLNPDLIVLAGYMRILASSTVNDYVGRMLNIHPSLLPAYPGLDTYRRALEAGEKWHGTTVHFVIPELDAGPPILQYRVSIRTDETEPQLRERVQRGEYIIYPRVIGWLAEGRLAYTDGQIVIDGKAIDSPLVQDEQQSTDVA